MAQPEKKSYFYKLIYLSTLTFSVINYLLLETPMTIDIKHNGWRRKWQSTPALLPGKSHGRRSLIGYSPWGRKELKKKVKTNKQKKKTHSGTTYMSKSFNLKYLSKVKPVAYLVAQDSKIYTFTCQTFN